MRTFLWCLLTAAVTAAIGVAFVAGYLAGQRPGGLAQVAPPTAPGVSVAAAPPGAVPPVAVPPAAAPALPSASPPPPGAAPAAGEGRLDSLAFAIPAGWRIVDAGAERVVVAVSASDPDGGCALSRGANPLAALVGPGRLMAALEEPRTRTLIVDQVAGSLLRAPRQERAGRRDLGGVDWVESVIVGAPLKGATAPGALERIFLLMTERAGALYTVICGHPVGGDGVSAARGEALIASLRFAG
jgi:hypothetical protein